MQNQLTAEIRRLVPECVARRSDGVILGSEINLEVCRVALSRWAWENEMSIELQENFLPELHMLWQDLTPFEQQPPETLEFLSQYLLPSK